MAYFCICSVFFINHVLEMLQSKKNMQTSKIIWKWVSGSRAILDRKLENLKKIKIFDDYLFLGIKYCQNTVSKLHFTRLPPLDVLSFLSMSEIGLQKKNWIGVGGCCKLYQIFFECLELF